MLSFFRFLTGRDTTIKNKSLSKQNMRSGLMAEEKQAENVFQFLPSNCKAYMLVKETSSPHMTKDLDLNPYLLGDLDEYLKKLYIDNKAYDFSENRAYAIYNDLAELLINKNDNYNLGASDNYSYVLCLDKTPKEVHEDISKGKFHQLIVNAINFRELYRWYYIQKHSSSFKDKIIDVNEFRASLQKQNSAPSMNK